MTLLKKEYMYIFVYFIQALGTAKHDCLFHQHSPLSTPRVLASCSCCLGKPSGPWFAPCLPARAALFKTSASLWETCKRDDQDLCDI